MFNKCILINVLNVLASYMASITQQDASEAKIVETLL